MLLTIHVNVDPTDLRVRMDDSLFVVLDYDALFRATVPSRVDPRRVWTGERVQARIIVY